MMQLDNQEWGERQEQIEREISSINQKWESAEMKQILADGDVKPIRQWELDNMRQRELRNGCFER